MTQVGEGLAGPTEAYDIEAKLADFEAFLIEKSVHSRRGDRYMGPFSAALAEELEVTPALQVGYATAMQAKYNNYPHLRQVTVRSLIKAAAQDVFYAEESVSLPQFPADYLLPSQQVPQDTERVTANWRHLIQRVVTDKDRFGTFLDDLKNRNVQSNKFQRYVAVEGALHILKSYDRLPDKPAILDIGCSQNHGNTVLASNIPFYGVRPATGEDAAISDFINDNLHVRLAKGRCDGVDIAPLDDDSSEWALFNSLYLDELQKPGLVEDYQMVDNTHPDNVHFVQADFSAEHIETNPPAGLLTNSYDVATIVTMLYQLNETEQERVVLNALSYLKDDGLLIVQDFYEEQISADQTQIEYKIIKDWENRTGVYRTLLFDKANPGRGFQELFVWQNARCEQVSMGSGLMGTIESLLMASEAAQQSSQRRPA
jgi:hypothetical protein